MKPSLEERMARVMIKSRYGTEASRAGSLPTNRMREHAQDMIAELLLVTGVTSELIDKFNQMFWHRIDKSVLVSLTVKEQLTKQHQAGIDEYYRAKGEEDGLG